MVVCISREKENNSSMGNRQGHQKNPRNRFYPEFLILFLIKHRKQIILYPQKAEIENTLPPHEIRNLEYRFDYVFSFCPQYYLMHVTQPSLKRIFTEKVMYCTLSNTYRAFIDRCSIVASICILKHALEICSLESYVVFFMRNEF